MLYGMQDLVRNMIGYAPKSSVGGSQSAGQSLQAEFDHKLSFGTILSDSGTISPSLRRDEFWALRNINFELKRGDRLGIVGSNGSGKSTLLRMLNGIFPPDQGEVLVRGRMGALIALGAGFHPHMTGRENIYLNGSILGMSRDVITDRFNKIVDFAELGDFIDAPVSTYSSGMYVRLGFSIACHVDVAILLVDEVLSVGDLAFQAKSVKRLYDYVDKGGTVIFVSHNLVTVQSLCNRVMWLDRGNMRSSGTALDVISEYQANVDEDILSKTLVELKEMGKSTGDLRIMRCILLNDHGNESQHFVSGEALTVVLHYETSVRIIRPAFWVAIGNQLVNLFVASMLNDSASPEYIEGEGKIVCRFERLSLIPQFYVVQAGVRDNNGATLLIEARRVASFRVIGRASDIGFNGPVAEAQSRVTTACVIIPYTWTLPDGTIHRVPAHEKQDLTP
jgi:ABC-type polysaccharide/polyol phosphate transport system ATPase subunit